jgi:hypothetical protein
MHAMKEPDLDNEIKRLLTWVVVCIKTDNYQGLSDVNVYTESFSAGILNHIWDCDLKNLNTYKDRNYPGIDLGDGNAEIAVQVTSTDTREKVTHTITNFESNPDNACYKKLYIVIYKDEKHEYRSFTTNGKYEFDKDHILSLNELCFIIAGLSVDKKKALLAHLHSVLNIPTPAEFRITTEEYLVTRFFGALVEMAAEDVEDVSVDDMPDNADLEEKQARFAKYWDFVKRCYEEVIAASEERLFTAAYDRLDASERIQLRIFLQRQSEKALLKTENPVDAIDTVRKEIIKRANIGFLSEGQVENYLYYQLYMCKLLPNPGAQVAAVALK